MIKAGAKKSEETGEIQYEISDSELLALAQRELDSASGWTGTKLAEARRRNLNAYFGNPRGDEREGRSQVRSRDVFEQVEWALPPLMEIFLSGNEVVKFALRSRAQHGGRNPSWTSYEKLREVIERRMFSQVEELLPVMASRTSSTFCSGPS